MTYSKKKKIPAKMKQPVGPSSIDDLVREKRLIEAVAGKACERYSTPVGCLKWVEMTLTSRKDVQPHP